MASIDPQIKTWNREDYHQAASVGLFAEGRVELIQGEILVMSPMKPQHAAAIQLVSDALRRLASDEYSVRVQLPLAIGEDSEPEPDVAIVIGKPRDYKTHPATAALVVEISDSTLVFDRSTKRQLYARAAIAEYWVLNLVGRQLEICTDPVDGEYRDKAIKHPKETASPIACQGARLLVADLLP